MQILLPVPDRTAQQRKSFATAEINRKGGHIYEKYTEPYFPTESLQMAILFLFPKRTRVDVIFNPIPQKRPEKDCFCGIFAF